MSPCVLLIDVDVGSFDDQFPAIRHSIARIDGEIEQRTVELIGIDKNGPHAARQNGLNRDALSQGATKYLGDPSRCSILRHIQLPRPKGSEEAHTALPLQHAADERAESVGNGVGLEDGLQLRRRVPQPERNLGRHPLGALAGNKGEREPGHPHGAN